MKLFTLKRFFVVTLLMCLGISQGWAGGSHGNHTGTVTVISNGNGSVYIANQNGDRLDANGTYSWSCGGSSDNDSKTLYLHATPVDEDYDFTGWSGSGNSNNTPYQITVNANSNSNERSYTATFTHKVDYSAIMNAFAVGEGGYVQIIGGDKSSGEPAATATLKQDGYSAKDITYTFTLKATPKPGYQFVGWRTSEGATRNESTNASYNSTLTCKINAPEQEGNYYAFFEKLYYSKVTLISPSEAVGKVNVSATNASGDYIIKSELTITNNTTTHTYYPKAQPTTGYTFEGWYDNPDFNGSKLSLTGSGNNERFSVNTSNSSYNAPEERTYYAKFVKNTDNAEYLRNRETGRFLMNGGTNSTHAVVGNYAKMPIGRVAADNGEVIYTPYGHLSAEATVNGAAAIWEITEVENGFYTISCNGNALTPDDTKYFNDTPLYRYVTTATLNASDKHQQWEIVTLDKLNEEIAKATPDNPVNVSHLIKNPNFDLIDGTSGSGSNLVANGWNISGPNGTTVTNQGLGGNNVSDEDFNNNWSISIYNSLFSQEKKWDCFQYFENDTKILPGYYVVTCQGLEETTNKTNFYAWSNPEGSQVERTIKLARYNSADFSGGDLQAKAAIAFNAGKYTNVLPVIKVGDDGKLIFGVKTDGSSDNTGGWVVFDNFQLYYLGTTDPGHNYDYDVIGSTRKAEMVDGALTLTGTWREVDMKDVTTPQLIKTANLKSVIDGNSALVVDATNATLVCRPKVQSTNTNVLILANNADEVGNDANVIVNNECASLVLDEAYNFATSVANGVFAETATVNRTLRTDAWNTLCLPFDLPKSALGDGAKIRYLKGVTNNGKNYTLNFKGYELDADDYVHAHVPYIVWSGKSGKVSLTATEQTINTEEPTEEVEGGTDGATFYGTYTPIEKVEPGYYIISNNKFWLVEEGKNENDKVSLDGFRGYFEVPGAANALGVSFEDEDVTGITSVNDTDEDNDNYYNVAGQRVNATTKGIIIKNGRKFINK